MGRDAAKACENQCFRCRKEAAKYNDKLGSREGAAELLGISVSSLADYELGNTKVIPVDKVVLMADIYNAPELMAWYCSSECLIGKSLEMPSPEIASVERTTMKLLKQLRQGDIEQVKEKLIDITADGIISKELVQKDGYSDCQSAWLAGLQKRRYREYLDSMKKALLARLPSIGVRTGPWTHGTITREEAGVC